MMLIVLVIECETKLAGKNKTLKLTQKSFENVSMELVSYQDMVAQCKSELHNEEKQLDSLKAKVNFGMPRGG